MGAATDSLLQTIVDVEITGGRILGIGVRGTIKMKSGIHKYNGSTVELLPLRKGRFERSAI